jgi:TPR repeat protein
LDVEDLAGDGSLSPATLRLISDAVRGAALRRAGTSKLEVLARPARPGPGGAANCDLKRAATRSAQFLVCGEYAQVDGSTFATLRLLDLSGRLLATQTLQGSAKVLLSKADAAADGLLAARWPARAAPPPGPAAAGPAPPSGRGDLRGACQRGDAWSCVEVARSYGVEKNPLQSTPWIRRACDLRNGPACAVLGENYERGRGLPVDYPMAAKLYDFSCSVGDGDACCSFGRMIVDGRGVPRDVARAKSYFDRGCQIGSGVSCTDAGLWASKPLLQTGQFPNMRAAFDYYEKACELSEPIGCNNLAAFYEEGWGGVVADSFKAQHYYDRACRLGRELSCADRNRVAKANEAKDVHVYIHRR